MADELQEAWKQPRLTEEEETVVVCEEDTSSDQAEQVALCLLWKLHTKNLFNTGAIKTVMKNVWKPMKGVIVKELDGNLFAFHFFPRQINKGPWAFDGNRLMIKEMTGSEQPSEVVFNKARFWVKVYNVPALKQTSNFAKFLASLVGEFAAVLRRVCVSLNFKVNVDIDKPLRRGVKTIIEGKAIWIRLRLVKLQDFGYP
ncbi:hypothetical protein Cgig2_024180 [Carnegiea gigantea]|uniref:DUF4283 domain-containing protein n=1 Tax=Carnegiea gigantea TaxID=171969 RepID=A0A9Q1KB13_9CARY|nr:hypothetical protein Cgig2_024180 [Carnegiea gigantea]